MSSFYQRIHTPSLSRVTTTASSARQFRPLVIPTPPPPPPPLPPPALAHACEGYDERVNTLERKLIQLAIGVVVSVAVYAFFLPEFVLTDETMDSIPDGVPAWIAHFQRVSPRSLGFSSILTSLLGVLLF